jgi:NADH:ubiquinone oxidoreductase subunit 6 (subunit J)
LIQTASVIAATAAALGAIGLRRADAERRRSGLSDEAEVTRAFGSPAEMVRLFLTDHLLAFEITSIVLLVAAVGGVVLGMRSEDEALIDAGNGERA